MSRTKLKGRRRFSCQRTFVGFSEGSAVPLCAGSDSPTLTAIPAIYQRRPVLGMPAAAAGRCLGGQCCAGGIREEAMSAMGDPYDMVRDWDDERDRLIDEMADRRARQADGGEPPGWRLPEPEPAPRDRACRC